MKDGQIIYILGAGASVNALPIVNEMVNRMEIFFFTISLFYPDLKENANYKGLLERMEWLINSLRGKRTIDTYAKELYIEDSAESRENLSKLKSALSYYLIFEQQFSDADLRVIIDKIYRKYNGLHSINKEATNGLQYLIKYKPAVFYPPVFDSFDSPLNQNLARKVINALWSIDETRIVEKGGSRAEETNKTFSLRKTSLDNRYINYLVDVLDKDKIFPNKIKICSWNYDTQINIALQKLNLHAVDISKSLWRLNGCIIAEEQQNEFNKLFTKDEEVIKNYENTLAFLKKLFSVHHDHNCIKFAFESTGTPITDNISSNATELVIIGYSFPFSNRNTDKEIIRAFLPETNSKLHYEYGPIGDNNTEERVLTLNIHIQTPTEVNYLLARDTIISIIQSVEPGYSRVIGSDELIYTKEYEHGLSILMPGANQRKKIERVKSVIKFTHNKDTENFYIPHTF